MKLSTLLYELDTYQEYMSDYEYGVLMIDFTESCFDNNLPFPRHSRAAHYEVSEDFKNFWLGKFLALVPIVKTTPLGVN